jgi:hypothetical protein
VSARVLLVGLGDLGRRLAAHLAAAPEVGELVLASRSEDGPAFAALAAACGTARVRFTPLDASDRGAVERLLRSERPDLLVQCATLLSPWLLPDVENPLAAAVLRAGFALQLPAQLPLVRTLMEAVRETGLGAPVVNGSYPDLTHPILHCLGLAPAVGLGNAGMIHALVVAALRRQGLLAASEPVRVLGHHAHLTAAALAQPPADPSQRPRVYLGEEGRRADDLAYAGPPLRSERGMNALPAASGLPVLRALLGGPPVRTSAPGPGGLPGGYPIRVEAGNVDLDLPPGLTLAEAVAFHQRSVRLDGVDRVEADGTVHFTEEARHALAAAPELAEPLHPDDALARFRLLVNRLGRLGRLGLAG